MLLDAKVDAGQTLMRALGSKVELETRYGGRFVQSIDGLSGSLEDQRDWFWFVNGYEGDRSASSYRLRDGDVAWLDYRGWQREGEARVVVGAFPEPFLHGYDGKTRPAAVRFEGSRSARRELGRDDRRRVDRAARDAGARRCERARAPRRADGATAELLGQSAGDPFRLVLSGDPEPDPQVRGAMSPVPAAALLAAAGTAALLADRIWSVALLIRPSSSPSACARPPSAAASTSSACSRAASACSCSRRSSGRRPTARCSGKGRRVPVLGPLDVTTTEMAEAALNALRLAALGLAFAAYALLLDHDRLVASAGRARRSALAVALATRLVPSLERDAAGLAESVRGRGVRLEGARGYATLLSPLVAGSLERATGLAEAMEARGFGRPGTTRAPRPPWSTRDRLALAAAVLLVAVAALWL